MNLQEFLNAVGGKESQIITYFSEKEALEAVKQNVYALRYVNKKVFIKTAGTTMEV